MGLKVLSLFDGMSCGQLALTKLGIKIDKYYASEIDKYAIQVTQNNFPDTIQVGDVSNLKAKDFADIDLILAGSPCQGFSFAGKQLAFDDPRSALFFEFIRLLKEIKPKYFLLENVRMKKEFLQVITEQVSMCYPEHKGDDLLGGLIEPILINSALLSAQSRQRYYWTNIPGVEQPEDKGVILRDILEDYPDEKYNLSESKVNRVLNEKRGKGFFYNENSEKIGTVIAGYHKEPTDGSYIEQKKPVADIVAKNGKKLIKENIDKAMTLTARDYKGLSGRGSTGVRLTKPKQVGKTNTPGHDILKRVYSEDGKSPTITAHAGKGTVPKIETKPKQVGVAVDIKGHDILKRVYSPDGKSPTLTAHGGGNTEPKVVSGGAFRGRYDGDKTQQKLELRKDKKSNAITTVSKDSIVVKDVIEEERIIVDAEKRQLLIAEATKKGYTVIEDGDCFDINYPKSKTRRGRNMKYKCNALTPTAQDYMRFENLSWRKLTPLECERLQTVPDGYTKDVSNTQRYKMLGNGWTVDVIAHILKNMEI